MLRVAVGGKAHSPVVQKWTSPQGCGLGLDVLVLRRSGDVPTSCLVSRKIINVSVSGGRHLGLGHLRLVPKTNFRPNCACHNMQCEQALDVVSSVVTDSEFASESANFSSVRPSPSPRIFGGRK